MRADSFRAAVAAAEVVGCPLSLHQTELLQRYHEFLASEAITAGGIGPNERDRLWRRHIADSMLFGIELSSAGDCVDVGTGVGLPGIPLAIAFPSVEFTLVDRAGRRVDMVRRAVSVLGLHNCTVRQVDIADVSDRFDRVVSRGSLPPLDLMIHVKHLLRAGGVAIIGLSARYLATNPLPASPEYRAEVVTIEHEVLDTTVSLLRIEAT